MKMKFIYGLGLLTLSLAVVSCGGEGETEETEGTEETAVTYTIDTEASQINWWNKEGEEKGHTGTVKILDGTYTVEGEVIKSASMNIDMRSIQADSERLAGHLMTGDFFGVMKPDTVSADSINWVFADTVSTFTFDKHENNKVYGTANVAGLDFPIEAPVTMSEGKLEVGEFSIDMSGLSFFAAEIANAEMPAEEKHDPNIGFTATIVGKK